MSLISELLGVPAEGDPEGAPVFEPGAANDHWNATRLDAAEGEGMIFVVGKGWSRPTR
jgi:hypothetical protein